MKLIQLAPFYETEDSVRKCLSEGQISIDVDKWDKEKSLIIVDSLRKYVGNESLEFDNDSNKKLVDHVKTMGKSGVSILGDKGAFYYKHRIQDLINYELSCLLNTKWI